jgi:hypothetical protein
MCAESVLCWPEAATFSGGLRWQRGLGQCSSEVCGGLRFLSRPEQSRTPHSPTHALRPRCIPDGPPCLRPVPARSRSGTDADLHGFDALLGRLLRFWEHRLPFAMGVHFPSRLEERLPAALMRGLRG